MALILEAVCIERMGTYAGHSRGTRGQSLGLVPPEDASVQIHWAIYLLFMVNRSIGVRMDNSHAEKHMTWRLSGAIDAKPFVRRRGGSEFLLPGRFADEIETGASGAALIARLARLICLLAGITDVVEAANSPNRCHTNLPK